jgi:recombination protein RecA
MIALGLDPSMGGFGFCVHDPYASKEARVVRRGTFASPSTDVFVRRYLGLRACVEDLLEDHPDVSIVGVESPPFGEQWSEGLYALFVLVNEALYTRRKDVVYFDPVTVKMLAKGDPKARKGKMFKGDMIAEAVSDTSPTLRWNHNEADAYLIARYAARFWQFLGGSLPDTALTPAERHAFSRSHTFTKGSRKGEVERKGLIYRENDRFYRFSQRPRLDRMSPATEKVTSEKSAPEKPAPVRRALPPIVKPSTETQKVLDLIFKMTGQKPDNEKVGAHPHVPTGSVVLDMLIGGTPLPDGKGFVCPGFPRQRIVELYGAEASGKTTTALSAVVTTQRAGGKAMFLDFENALDHSYARAIGVDFDVNKLLNLTPTTLEEGMKMMYIGIKAGYDLIVIDSVAAMVPKTELEKKIDDPAKVGVLAAKMSQILPKMVQWLKGTNTCIILLNQMRAVISTGGPGSETENTAGGKAVKFYASLRVKVTRIRSEFIEKKDPVTFKVKKQPYGNLVQAKIVKDKMDARQGQTGEIFIRYGAGLDEYLSVIEGAVPRKIITKNGASFGYSGQSFRGREQLRKYLIENPKAFADLRSKVQEALLLAAPQVIDADEIEEENIKEALGFDPEDGDEPETGEDSLLDEV